LNATKHCRISVRRWGGVEDDYRAIHDFIDSTKILCPDYRHRIFHTMWAVNLLVVPIFGHTIVNSDGVEVDTKDLCERDHLLVDYANKFIPTLNDFVGAIEIDLAEVKESIELIHQEHFHNKQLCKLLLSPLDITGKFESLLLTHNSWFINTIASQLHNIDRKFENTTLSQEIAFRNMRLESWMDNGLTYPPSAKKLQSITRRN
jgi:hypothetical protein